MSLLKKLFGTLAEKPWEENQAAIDNTHSGRTFNLSYQMSAVIIIFGVSTAIFSLVFTGYFVDTNTYFSSFYIFTTLHGMHLLGGLFFWGKVSSRIFKLSEKDYANEEKNINALSLYWLFLFIVWIVFFTIMFVYNDSVIAWCKSLIS